MKPEFRKVQSLMNDTSFAIVIPKEMVKKLGISKGDTCKVTFSDEMVTYGKPQQIIIERVR